MRTKTLLLTAAMTMAGIASSFAQVYSQNIVGYVTTPVTKSVYKMIANPLNTTNNTLAGVLTQAAGVQDGDQYFSWNGTAYVTATFASFLGGWDSPTTAFAPGGGGFYLTTTGNTNLTFVGEVLQGNLTNSVAKGYHIVSSQVPQTATVDALGLSAALVDGDQLLQWTGTKFNTATKATFLGGWDVGTAPTMNVGESAFINSQNAVSWTRTFTP